MLYLVCFSKVIGLVYENKVLVWPVVSSAYYTDYTFHILLTIPLVLKEEYRPMNSRKSHKKFMENKQYTKQVYFIYDVYYTLPFTNCHIKILDRLFPARVIVAIMVPRLQLRRPSHFPPGRHGKPRTTHACSSPSNRQSRPPPPAQLVANFVAKSILWVLHGRWAHLVFGQIAQHYLYDHLHFSFQRITGLIDLVDTRPLMGFKSHWGFVSLNIFVNLLSDDGWIYWSPESQLAPVHTNWQVLWCPNSSLILTLYTFMS